MTRTKAYKSKNNKLYIKNVNTNKNEQVDLPSLEDLPVKVPQLEKAVSALGAFVAKKNENSNDLLQSEENYFLVVTLKKMNPRSRHMPHRVPIPNPLIDPRKGGVCLFVKDPSADAKAVIAEKKITFVKKVMGVEKLKGKYKPFEARRQLMDTYAVFLADDRVIPLLPKLLGKKWLDSKRQPLPVSMKPASLKAELERALSSTSLFVPQGTCTTIKVGSSAEHTAEQLVENIKAVLPHLAKLPEGYANIQALHLKTTSSASLPVYASETTLTKEPLAITEEDSEADVPSADGAASKKDDKKKRKRATDNGEARETVVHAKRVKKVN